MGCSYGLENHERSSDVEDMLEHLSEAELEIAARTSYAYVTLMSGRATVNDRKLYAARMAERYLKSKKDKLKALKFMKATLEFRREMDTDGLRNAATDPDSDDHIPLRKFLATKQCYAMGKDIEGRSTFIFIPRRVQNHDLEWTRKGFMYTLERAIACSSGDNVNCAVDFSGFSRRHVPPMHVGKDIMTCLRNHYIGNVHRIYLIDAPSAFLWLWEIIKHFAGKATRDKIQFVNSAEQKKKVIGKLYRPEQVPSWMLPSGQKNRDLDLDEYLSAPFDQAFDDE